MAILPDLNERQGKFPEDALWPDVNSTDWCGQWRATEEVEKQNLLRSIGMTKNGLSLLPGEEP